MALESSTATGTTITGGESTAFECNICFDLAQDPVITPCGHLHCWPCIYKWLNIHSNSHQCPVCRTLIQEQELVPLYGRGNAPTDPRLISFHNPEIPQRPVGQRPETVVVAPRLRRASSNFEGSFGQLSPVFSVRFYDVYGGPSRFVYGGSIGEDEHGNDKTMMKILVFVLLFVLFDVMAM